MKNNITQNISYNVFIIGVCLIIILPLVQAYIEEDIFTIKNITPTKDSLNSEHVVKKTFQRTVLLADDGESADFNWYLVSEEHYNDTYPGNGDTLWGTIIDTCETVCEDLESEAMPKCIGWYDNSEYCRKTVNNDGSLATASKRCTDTTGSVGIIGNRYCCCEKIYTCFPEQDCYEGEWTDAEETICSGVCCFREEVQVETTLINEDNTEEVTIERLSDDTIRVFYGAVISPEIGRPYSVDAEDLGNVYAVVINSIRYEFSAEFDGCSISVRNPYSKSFKVDLYGDYYDWDRYSSVDIEGNHISDACGWEDPDCPVFAIGDRCEIYEAKGEFEINTLDYCEDGKLEVTFEDSEDVNVSQSCNAIHRACIYDNDIWHCCQAECEDYGCTNSVEFDCNDWSCLKGESPPCSDDTQLGECSSTVPKYCDNSNLIDNCEVCGCDDGLSFSRDTCETTGSCSHLVVAGNEPIADAGGTITVDFGTPGAILDGSNSFDINGLDLTYKWEYEGTVISELTNNPKALFKYPSEGTFTVTLTVTSLGLSDQDTATIIVLPKQGCSETSARYFPPDTVCNKKWPSKQGNIILGNTLERSCDIIEVCDENLDYMIDEAITCCGSSDGVSKLSSEQEKLACEDSHLFSYNSNFESNFNEFSFKRCLSSYLINSLGAFAINMQDYWYPEICCSGSSFCLNFGDTSKYFTSEPHPCDSDSSFSGAECNVGNLPCNIYNLFGIKWAKAGKWKSDTDTEKNNIAMLDTPAHASLNLFSTGTCVDYSNSLTTLLRKAGFLEDEVLSVIGVGHGYNLVKLPGDINWHFVDTVGNAGGGIQTSPSTGWYSYCTSSYSSILMHGCYNDVKGKSLNNCPDISSEVVGCEGIGPCASFKDYCFFNKNCCDGSQCSFFQCKDCKANEESCFSNGDCCDGSQCDFFKCKDCKANEDSCLSDGDCCSGKCKWNWWFWNKCE